MAQGGNQPLQQALVRLENGVSRWRSGRARLGPMPEPLWKEAVRVAREVGVGVVARRLNLGHAVLKRRVGGVFGRVAAPAFVDVGMAGPMLGGTTVEVTEADGSRLVVRMGLGTAVDVSTVVAAFRGRR